jgi:hypothetical protein
MNDLISSLVKEYGVRLLHTQEVTGSSPVAPTIISHLQALSKKTPSKPHQYSLRHALKTCRNIHLTRLSCSLRLRLPALPGGKFCALPRNSASQLSTPAIRSSLSVF